MPAYHREDLLSTLLAGFASSDFPVAPVSKTHKIRIEKETKTISNLILSKTSEGGK